MKDLAEFLFLAIKTLLCGNSYGEGSMSKAMLGVLLALSAAALNASIGVFSKVLLQNGLSPQDIAFFKTVCAFVILSLVLANKPLSVQKKKLLIVK